MWELQERLENAHTFVREQTGKSINRQKRYHDRNLSFDTIEPDDAVYVLFPVRKSGCTRKWTSFWRGPFKVSKKLSEVLFEVDCGRYGKGEPIRLQRIRKAKDQILPGEDIEQEMSDSEIDEMMENQDASGQDLETENIEGRPHRTIRKPAWLKDFVYRFRSDMDQERRGPNIKITPRKAHAPALICPLCKKDLPNRQVFTEHVLKCPEKRQKCEKCGVTFKKMQYLRTHWKRQHPEEEAPTSLQSTDDKTQSADEKESDNDSDWDQDPPYSVGDDAELYPGRTVRKRVCPNPVAAPLKHPKASATISSAEATASSSDFPQDKRVFGTAAEEDKREGNSARKSEQNVKNPQRVNMGFSVKAEDGSRTVQRFDLKRNKEQIVSTTVTNLANVKAGDININLADVIGRVNIDSSHIQISVKKEEIQLEINDETD